MTEKSRSLAGERLDEELSEQSDIVDLDEAESFSKPENDRPLTFHWKADPEIIRPLNLSKPKNRDLERALLSLLTEAVLSHESGQWVSYSRRRGFYSGLMRYHGTAYTYGNVLWAVEYGLKHGLIEEERALPGDHLRTERQSRFRATQELIDVWSGACAEFQFMAPVRLRDLAGHLIDFRNTDATAKMERDVRNLNEFLGSIHIDLNTPDAVQAGHHVKLDGAYLLPTLPAIYRMFNRSSFSKGGRAYGWWQSLPKARRASLRLNGESVSEPDFEAMHAAMLYAALGKSLDFDPYETGTFPREHGKRAFAIGINARSNQGAISALAKKLDCSPSYASKLQAAIRARNKPIADAGAFGSDRGTDLMRADSDITIGVLKECAKAGVPVLPIHDSMLTPARHEGKVAGFMRDSFGRRFRDVTPCRVRVSGPEVLHMPSASPLLSCPSSSAVGAFLALRPCEKSVADRGPGSRRGRSCGWAGAGGREISNPIAARAA